MTKIKEFENLAYLQAVRNDHLNPLIRRVENEIAPTVERLDHEISETIKNVTLTESTNTLRFDKGDGGYKDIVLTPILPKFEGIGVQSLTGFGPSTGVKLIQFPDATITPTGSTAAVGFDWTSIFEHNQKWPEAVIKGTVSHVKNIIFLGDPDAAKVVGDGISLKIPKVEPLMVSIPDKGGLYVNPRPITSIEVAGEVANTAIVGDKLTLTLNAGGGGGGTVTNQNFKGFFESLGDLQSKVDDPVHGKSFAYVKDSTLGGSYYTAYFYVNSNWTELKQDPALTYFSPSASTNQGVFSIKPSDKITLDSQGQLDLDGLSTPQLPQYFVGFFDTLDQLKAEVTKPIAYKTHAYVKGPSGRGWLNYRAEMQGSASLWNIVAPLGSFSFVDEKASSFTQVFGIKKSDAWELDSQGLLTMKGGTGPGPGGALNVGISGSDGQVEVHDVTSMTFNKGKSFAEFTGANKNHVLLDHPQRVINYNSTFEQGYNTRDYEGNIFYDETSRTWMGWGFSKDASPDTKWTRIAHPHMSDEVRDLVRRVPAKAKSVVPGLIGDHKEWDHIGVTFIEAGSNKLPEELKGKCGGYITTVVQDKDTAGVTIPQYRMQTCLADRADGGTWIRRLLATGSPGSAISWSPWVKSSFGSEEILRHEKDPNAHKDVMKFAAVHSIEGKMKNILNQTLENVPGALRADGNYDVLMDTYGHILLQKDRGSVPYDHWFDAEGVVEFSGYEGNNVYPVGKWTVHLRIKRKDTTNFVDIQKFNYVHQDQTKRYPPMRFKADKLELVRGDELYMHVYFDNPTGLLNKHPEIYIVPVRSYIAYQDSETAAGTLIAASYRKLFGNMDVNGDVAVKVHHRNPDDLSSGIRVYGTKISKTPTDMNRG